MEGADVLIVIAEVAVAFAGFAGVVSVFRSGGEWDAPDVFRFRFMVTASLMTVLFALLPFVLFHLGIPLPTVWSVCSGLLTLCYLGNLVFAIRGAGRTRGTTGTQINARIQAFLSTGGTLAMLTLAANTLHIGFAGEFGPYLVGLAWLLVISGLMFVRLLLLNAVPRES